MDIIADGFFEGLTAVQLDTLLHSGELIEFKKETVFIKEGACESTFYYIQKGSVNVFINSGNNDYVIAALNAGSAVGELVLIDSCPRSASVKTTEDSSIYKFDIHCLESSPELQEILGVIKKKYLNNCLLDYV